MVEDSLFITTEALAAQLGSVQVIDASMKPGVDAKSAHFGCRIPGARFFSITEIKDTDSTLALAFPTPAQFASAASKIGLNKQSLVVVYDQFGLFSAPRGYFMLKYFGFPDVKILEGGLPKWKTEGREVEAGEYNIFGAHPAEDLQVEPQPGMLINFPEVEALVHSLQAGDSSRQLWDPRSQAGFNGGSVPQSINVDVAALLTPEGILKPKEEIVEVLTAGGLDVSRPIVATCMRGIVSAIGYVALKHLGREDAVLYGNSYDEWVSFTQKSIKG
jgi:thiosulfate/3-mercaptopyruvate sulfurtransferase